MTTSPAKLPRDQREALLLDSARDEFGRVGYAGASLGAIAVRADVSKALVLSYFGSKDGLYAACVERAAAHLSARIEEVISSPLEPLEMALATLATIIEGLEGRQQDWNVINDRTAPAGTPGGDAARAQRRLIAAQTAGAIRNLERFGDLDADDLDLLLRVWMNTVGAVVGWWLRHPDRTPAEAVARCRRLVTALLD